MRTTDINEQILKLGAAPPMWGLEANDLVELSRNVERVAANVNAWFRRGVPGLLETTTVCHDTVLYWEEQDAAPALSADIRVLRATFDSKRAEVHAAAAHFKFN
ncbi:hypothetical protein IHQ71_30480 (plasmid) [Rhizobium sp. TH2]|uniref:hypothetical protein n=1 Tax=Rhizobium sp. TH2 TaxID=2775403 RepID=UPI002157843F|nr:hypothetical protein [Rhizobium sp. TH2]UVC12558.1 hypothetical protein IHQ71_30480 [Rhizobium sp. TH2]